MKALTALILAMAGAAMAVAAPEPGLPSADATEARPPLPAVKMQGGIAYLNGGAGLDESDYIKSRAAEFALQFIFSGRGGEYGVADSISTIRVPLLTGMPPAEAATSLVIQTVSHGISAIQRLLSKRRMGEIFPEAMTCEPELSSESW